MYYQAGIGSTSITSIDRVVAGATGAGLSENIREAYGFLANNYCDGDSIFLLGFSRGAYTARSIGGMLGAIGLLTKNGMRNFYECFSDFEGAGLANYKPQLPNANPDFTLKASSKPIKPYLDAYKAELLHLGLTRDVKIKAIGVWDTVGALGIPVHPYLQWVFRRTSFQDYQFYDTTIDNHVENAFHALALDEHRSAFKPTLWEKPQECQTKLKQVWFAGVHADIGGGSGSPVTSAADISLAWMMSKMKEWIAFDENYLRAKTEGNRAYNNKNRLPTPRWGCGPITESLTSFYTLGGSTTRTPDMYRQINYETGLPDPTMLQDTTEMVHASVRARFRLGGLDAAGKKYNSNSLSPITWKQQQTWIWAYVGDEPQGVGKAMPEDELGYYELQLMQMVDPGAQAELFGA